jgi:3-deoxy-D-manno-octulosonic acid (KDO) 8-phosphate synthase
MVVASVVPGVVENLPLIPVSAVPYLPAGAVMYYLTHNYGYPHGVVTRGGGTHEFVTCCARQALQLEVYRITSEQGYPSPDYPIPRSGSATFTLDAELIEPMPPYLAL